MKTIHLLLSLSMAVLFQMTSTNALAFDNGISFYSYSNYRGSDKEMSSGTYDNCSRWSYRSWKADDNCCVEITYHKRGGDYGKKKFCGPVKDFYAALRSVRDLKYGSSRGWQNVESVEILCSGGGSNSTASNRNGNSNNNSNDNRGNGQSMRGGDKDVKIPTWYGSFNFKGNTETYDPRRYNRFGSWQYRSLIIPKGYEVEFEFLGFGNRKKRQTLKAGEYADLYRVFNSWGFRSARGQNYWADMELVDIRKEGEGNYTGGGMKDKMNEKYKAQFYGSKDFRGNLKEYAPNLYTRVRGWGARSLIIPDGVKIKFTYYGIGNRRKFQTLNAGKYADLYKEMVRWGFRSNGNDLNPWADMIEVDIIKE